MDMQSESSDPQAVNVADPSNDTIVAISTPPGRGGIGIVRLSGPDAQPIAEPLLQLKHPWAHAQARYGAIVDDGARLDECVVTLFRAPHSYTAEDVVEIAAHGSPVVLDLLVRRALERGARLARPGEFTERAFLQGRLDLTQAEAVRDLIEAQTLYQARVAAEQLGGALSRRTQPIKEQLIALIVLLEAGIDFAEDDIDVAPDAEISARIQQIQAALDPVHASFREGRLLHSGFTLAIVGRPNAGKSSLFNRLIDRERAIVTATPGTTRDLVTERIALGGIPLELIDTAGLRETADEAESLGIERTRGAIAEADAVLVVLDASVSVAATVAESTTLESPRLHLSDEEAQLLADLRGRPVLVALNKIDLVPPDLPSTVPLPTAWPLPLELPLELTAPVIATSAVTGTGIDDLRSRILDRVRGGDRHEGGGMLTNLRHFEAITRCLASLEAAQIALSTHTPHEMLLLDLYASLRELDSLTGATTADDILNRIFSSFCIGK
jgi:tRNA modification GTPase